MTVAPELRPDTAVLEQFAALVGTAGPVCVAGGRTQWEVGGLPRPGTRELVAPSGVVSHQPEEMIVRVRAGTTVSDLDEVLAGGGQMVPLDALAPERATVGGVLAVGHSGPRRLRYGPVRDTVLEVRFVSAAGQLIKAGGPVVKNVTGYDLCRLLVGSLGTLGLMAEFVLRCYPRPSTSRWLRSTEPGAADPFEVHRRLYRPSSVLWDGSHVWVLLEGHPDDVDTQALTVLGPSFSEVPAPPALPAEGRLSLPPGRLPALGAMDRAWVAEVGVGVVHAEEPEALAAAVGLAWPPTVAPRVAELHHQLKRRFDPDGRLNPGRLNPGLTVGPP
jgi:FAD/FMN-containing dehydrogenase